MEGTESCRGYPQPPAQQMTAVQSPGPQQGQIPPLCFRITESLRLERTVRSSGPTINSTLSCILSACPELSYFSDVPSDLLPDVDTTWALEKFKFTSSSCLVSVQDPKFDFHPLFLTGDAAHNNLLWVREVWLMSSMLDAFLFFLIFIFT